MDGKLIDNVPAHLSLYLLIMLNSRFSSLSLGRRGYLFIHSYLVAFKVLLHAASPSSLRDNFVLHDLFRIAVVIEKRQSLIEPIKVILVVVIYDHSIVGSVVRNWDIAHVSSDRLLLF